MRHLCGTHQRISIATTRCKLAPSVRRKSSSYRNSVILRIFTTPLNRERLFAAGENRRPSSQFSGAEPYKSRQNRTPPRTTSNTYNADVTRPMKKIRPLTPPLEKVDLMPTLPKSSTEMANGPSQETAIVLFRAIEEKFPHKSLGEDRWYLVALSALLGVDPEYAGDLYAFLIRKPAYQTSESRKALVRRLREVLVKNVSLQGVCKPLEAVFAIAALERPEDRDFSFSREQWKAGKENRERGEKWLNTIYQHNLSTATDKFAAHKDFDFISRELTYGFYLSDHTILGPIETELVTLAGIMIQNLKLETHWHLRGTRRVGVSQEDVELVHQCIKMVADFGLLPLNKVPHVADIEHEV